jgi:chromosome segregation ATPase
VERQRAKMAEQNKELEKLRTENNEMSSLKTQCMEQEKEVERLSVRLEELSQARSEQARQLAEARAKAQSSSVAAAAARGRKEETREAEKELRELRDQLSKAREAALKFNKFQEAVQRLVSDARADSGSGDGATEGAPSNYTLIARLELLVAEHKELRDTVQCLGPSLQQLEQGFRTGYSDTIAILQTRA